MLRKTTDSLVIKPRLSAPARLAIALAAVVAVAGASLAGYWGGRTLLHQKLESRAQEIESLENELRENRILRREQVAGLEATRQRLEAEFQAAREQLEAELEANRGRLEDTRGRLEATRGRLEDARSSLARVTRQLQIDQVAYEELRKELEASNRQINELASELKFYRSIISPADGRSGVRIQEFDLQPTDTANEYRYRLVLIQALDHEGPVRGSVRFEVSGTEGGESRTIQSPDDSGGQIPADFKYFQNFVGTFSFPADFMPAEVKVIFEADDEAVVHRTYPWPTHGPAAGPA